MSKIIRLAAITLCLSSTAHSQLSATDFQGSENLKGVVLEEEMCFEGIAVLVDENHDTEIEELVSDVIPRYLEAISKISPTDTDACQYKIKILFSTYKSGNFNSIYPFTSKIVVTPKLSTIVSERQTFNTSTAAIYYHNTYGVFENYATLKTSRGVVGVAAALISEIIASMK